MSLKISTNKKLSIAAFAVLAAISCSAIKQANALPQYPIYFGLDAGAADVNWSAMIKHDNPNVPGMLNESNPAKAGGLGASYSMYTGLKISKNFALQAGYTHYPTTKIEFTTKDGEMPNSGPQNNSVSSGDSDIDCWDISLRPSINIWHNKIKSFMLVGLNIMNRNDYWAKWDGETLDGQPPPTKHDHYSAYNVGGTFGVGFDYAVKKYLDIETGFTYSTGSATASAEPMFGYFPFLYRAYMGVSYSI